MREIRISRFKAACLSVLDRVAKTRQPVAVTRFGKPVARILPPSAPPGAWLSAMKGSDEIRGDLVAPAVEPPHWEAPD